MTQTKIIVRIVADQRRQAARKAAVAAANKSGPSNQRRGRQPRQRTGLKNIEGGICGRSFTIKRLLAQQRNIDVKEKQTVQLFVKWLYVGEQYSQRKLEGHIIKISVI